MKSWLLSSVLTTLLIGFAASLVSAQNQQNKDIESLSDRLEKRGAKRVIEDGARATFSPDGKQLAYSKMPFGAGIMLRDIDSGKTTEVVGTGKDSAFSPGKKPLIAYVRGSSNEEEVWLVQPDGQNDRKLAAGGFPVWSGDGQTLYIHTRSRFGLMAVDFSAEEPQSTDLNVTIPSWYPAVSPDGKNVVFLTEGALVFTGIKKPGYSVRPLATFAKGGFPGWSPDGKQIAYGGFGYADQGGLWIYDLPTQKTRKIVGGPCTMPAWSKDGSKLVFDVRAAQNRHEVWMLDTKALKSEEDSGEK